MNLGSGIDLIEVGRFEREVARRGDALIEELFSEGEHAWCRRRRRPAEGQAMIYAAKEALFKALGTGKVDHMAWHDVELSWPEGARGPAITLAGETAAVAAAAGVTGLYAAVTTTRAIAVAWVVVTGADARRESVVSNQQETPDPTGPTARCGTGISTGY
jgi:holo-[acyl-carrier protein] synthase